MVDEAHRNDENGKPTESPPDPQDLAWAERIRTRYPNAIKLTDPLMFKHFRIIREESAGVGITEEEDMYRFAALPFAMSLEQQQSPYFSWAGTHVLAREDWNGTQKMDFIYKQLVPRPVPSSGLDFRPFFMGRTQVMPPVDPQPPDTGAQEDL